MTGSLAQTPLSSRSRLPSVADLSPIEVNRIIETALAEDLASGDATTRAVVPVTATAEGVFAAREAMVVAGLSVAASVFAKLSSDVVFTVEHYDGSFVQPKTVVAKVTGPAHTVLTGERVALNLLQRMCGVATRTKHFVDAIPSGARTRITDTRKTTPGLRALERYAVRCGGGFNHRNDLGSGLLVKDNHIALCGGVKAAVERARANAPHTMRIEIEVDRMSYLVEALDAGADVIMLDNFSDEQTREAMKLIEKRIPRPLIEASGGLTLERIAFLASIGVDILSIGSLTHGARAMDIGLDIVIRDT